jgi:hypothetical protein
MAPCAGVWGSLDGVNTFLSYSKPYFPSSLC